MLTNTTAAPPAGRAPFSVPPPVYDRSAATACRFSGTIRCLLPFPSHLQNAESRYTLAVVNVTTSVARQPVAYSVSSIARSRRKNRSPGCGALMSASTAVGGSTCGTRSHSFGEPSRFTAAALAFSSICRNR